MARGRTSPCMVFLGPTERAQLAHWQRSTTIQAGPAQRASIILLRAEGLALSEIGRRLGVGRRIVRKWFTRFLNQRMAGLADKPGRGRQPAFPPRGRGSSGEAGL
jgi:Homeodomain-like domain